jgi:hypothetical protein
MLLKSSQGRSPQIYQQNYLNASQVLPSGAPLPLEGVAPPCVNLPQNLRVDLALLVFSSWLCTLVILYGLQMSPSQIVASFGCVAPLCGPTFPNKPLRPFEDPMHPNKPMFLSTIVSLGTDVPHPWVCSSCRRAPTYLVCPLSLLIFPHVSPHAWEIPLQCFHTQGTHLSN